MFILHFHVFLFETKFNEVWRTGIGVLNEDKVAVCDMPSINYEDVRYPFFI